MEPEELKQWKRAGSLAHQALHFGVREIKKGALLLDVCRAVDHFIVENGGQPAWSTQVSCDATAAHATASFEDTTVLESELASIDVGAHINGFIGDNAATIDLSGSYKDHLRAAQDALNAAMKLVAPGVHTSEIGKVVEEAIVSHGLQPVTNLSGHGISPFVIHDAPSIPNVGAKGNAELVEGEVIAIEPFATNGVGVVMDSSPNELFSLVDTRPTRNPVARQVLQDVKQTYGPFPFAKRLIAEKYGLGRATLALRELVRNGSLEEHPPLVEKSGGNVAVFEHTLLVKDKPVVLTKEE